MLFYGLFLFSFACFFGYVFFFPRDQYDKIVDLVRENCPEYWVKIGCPARLGPGNGALQRGSSTFAAFNFFGKLFYSLPSEISEIPGINEHYKKLRKFDRICMVMIFCFAILIAAALVYISIADAP